MMHEYVVDGVSVSCKDPEYVSVDYLSLRVDPIGYCKNIELISKEVNQSIKQITWIDTQYKCSPIYHNYEPLKKGNCLNCNDPMLEEMNDFLQEVLAKTSTLHVNIISQNYNIDESQLLCNDILSILSLIKDNISDNLTIMTEAFYIQRTSLESFFDGMLTMAGIPNQGIIGEFTRLNSYISFINRELSGLDDLLPLD
jgi:hypothetical protein